MTPSEPSGGLPIKAVLAALIVAGGFGAVLKLILTNKSPATPEQIVPTISPPRCAFLGTSLVKGQSVYAPSGAGQNLKVEAQPGDVIIIWVGQGVLASYQPVQYFVRANNDQPLKITKEDCPKGVLALHVKASKPFQFLSLVAMVKNDRVGWWKIEEVPTIPK